LGSSFFPDIFHAVFNPAAGRIFSILSQLGLIMLMFLIGLEFDFRHLADNRRVAVSVSSGGILLPFSLGFGLGKFMHGAMGLTGSQRKPDPAATSVRLRRGAGRLREPAGGGLRRRYQGA
jgi:cytochrome bd-type quinol oxidase subunit 2